MCMNLFMIFDPSTSSVFSLNWLSVSVCGLSVFSGFWLCTSRLSKVIQLMIFFLVREYKNSISKDNFKVFFFFISLFIFLVLNNLFGLFSYIFTATSHLSVSMLFALSLWTCFMFYGWLSSMKEMFAHLVPLGTPLYLSVFMVLIESVSQLIRPLTLSVRLVANMVAGHLLLSLLSGISEVFISFFPVVSMGLVCLLVLETVVAVVQGYVYVMLLILYFSEIK